ncbi:MAG: hypothetical protein M3R59_09450 [Verrucomicrobiota bacterium]|nr:hypothetical protein [Verrucomicrobiota bacterium]
MIRVVLPQHLRTLAGVAGEVQVNVTPPVTIASILDAVEAQYPMLDGTMRDHVTRERRALVRFFADGKDISHEPPQRPLADAITKGREPFFVVGALAGG